MKFADEMRFKLLENQEVTLEQAKRDFKNDIRASVARGEVMVRITASPNIRYTDMDYYPLMENMEFETRVKFIKYVEDLGFSPTLDDDGDVLTMKFILDLLEKRY